MAVFIAETQELLRVCETGDGEGSRTPLHYLRRKKTVMARKTQVPTFDQMLETLRARSFEVTPSAKVAGGVLVSKYGVGAVLASAKEKGVSPGFAVEPGVLVRGEVSELLDRGYQKFIKTSQFELPATATQLHAIHQFTEELKELTGGISLYNESLGTTSDVYEYDRLQGREAAQPAPVQPWQLASGH
jgi:hypothetical protein